MTTRAPSRAQREAQLRPDQRIAKAFAPTIRGAYRAERNAVLRATAAADTPAEFRARAEKAISSARWVQAESKLWRSPELEKLWDAQQAALGTELEMTKRAKGILAGYGDGHAAEITGTQTDRMLRLPGQLADDLKAANRKFRSTMRRGVRESYAAAIANGENVAFIEALQATESTRYESAREMGIRSATTLRKVWFTTGDARVRPTHQRVNGDSRVVTRRGWVKNEPTFRVGGARLRFPRDPRGPAAEVINCRCFLEYRRVAR